MKYNFSINQVAAKALGDIDLIDCCIIEWLRDLCVSQSTRVAGKRLKGHTWVSYQYAIDDMPLLRFKSKEAFRKRLGKLIDKGYFTVVKDEQRIYVRPSTRVDSLFYEGVEPSTRVDRPSTTVDGSGRSVTGANRQPQLTNPNPITKPIGNLNRKSGKPVDNDHRGKPSPAKERMREIIKSRGIRQLAIITGG